MAIAPTAEMLDILQATHRVDFPHALEIDFHIARGQSDLAKETVNKSLRSSIRAFNSALRRIYGFIESCPDDEEFDPDEKFISGLEVREKQLYLLLDKMQKIMDKNDLHELWEDPLMQHFRLILKKTSDLRWHIMTRDGLIAASQRKSVKVLPGKELVEMLRSE